MDNQEMDYTVMDDPNAREAVHSGIYTEIPQGEYVDMAQGSRTPEPFQPAPPTPHSWTSSAPNLQEQQCSNSQRHAASNMYTGDPSKPIFPPSLRPQANTSSGSIDNTAFTDSTFDSIQPNTFPYPGLDQTTRSNPSQSGAPNVHLSGAGGMGLPATVYAPYTVPKYTVQGSQSQNDLVMYQPQTTHTVVVVPEAHEIPNMTPHTVLACIVLWFCWVAIGGGALVLISAAKASYRSGDKDKGDKWSRASIITSIVGAIVGAIATILLTLWFLDVFDD